MLFSWGWIFSPLSRCRATTPRPRQQLGTSSSQDHQAGRRSPVVLVAGESPPRRLAPRRPSSQTLGLGGVAGLASSLARSGSQLSIPMNEALTRGESQIAREQEFRRASGSGSLRLWAKKAPLWQTSSGFHWQHLECRKFRKEAP